MIFTYALLFFAIGALAVNGQACPNIVSRSGWNAAPPKSVYYLITPLPYVVIHHTVTGACSTLDGCAEIVRNTQSYHMNGFGWDDTGFSFFIGGDGKVYEGVGWNKEGAHTYGWNKKAAGIAFIGNFQDTEPSEKMLTAAKDLIACGKSGGFLRSDVKVLGGRQVTSTLSPGEKLYAKIQQWPEWTANPSTTQTSQSVVRRSALKNVRRHFN